MSENDIEMMANQIAQYFSAYPEERAISEIKNHINKFWEKIMKVRLIDYSKQKNNLSPLLLKAVSTL